MAEHLTQKQFEDYSQQKLTVRELLEVSEHLGDCEDCRHHIDPARNGDVSFFALRSELFKDGPDVVSFHLTPEQSAAYVDKNLAGEELQVVSDHLGSCEQCTFAIDDLRSFRNQIAPSLEVEYRPVPPSATPAGWWERRVAPLFAVFKTSPVPAFGTALTILLLAATGWLIWQATHERKEEIAMSPDTSPQPSQTPFSSPTPAPSTVESPRVVAQLNDGTGQLTLDQTGKLSGADDLPPGYQNLVKKALTVPRLERSSQLKGLARPSSSLMGSDNQTAEFSLTEPVGNVLLTNQPTFRWSAMEGASSYIVEVYDSNFKLVASSTQLNKNSWASPPLLRGSVYGWQVKAMKDGQEFTFPRPPAPQAKFRILDSARANELARAKRAYPSSHLTLGLLYAEAGLLEESEQEFRMLLKANPNSEIARSLLHQVLALKR